MKKTIEFNIEKDPELREYIKSCILNQVKSITREEIKEIAKAIIEHECKSKVQNLVD